MIYLTEIKAIDPKDGVLKTWEGVRVNASSWEGAEQTLINQGLGFCKVIGTLQEEFDGKK
jgi:hypothetical protein